MLKKLVTGGWLALAAALPVMAQDEATDAAAAEAAPADAAADASASTDSSSYDSSASDSSSSDSSSSDSGSSESAGEGRTFYVGLEYDQTTIDFAQGELRNSYAGRRFDSDFYKLRLGVRLFEGVGFEFHGGLPDSKGAGEELKTNQFYGLYFVPTGVLLETLEISARLGYAYTSLKNQTAKENFDGVSFGLNFELPLRRFGEGLPDLRLSAGGTVYQEDRDARVFGYHGGIRYDFTL